MSDTTIKLTSDLTITIGKQVTVHPVGADKSLPISGAIPPCDGPTEGQIVTAFLTSLGPPMATVRLTAPGKPNDGRVIAIYASTVAD